MNSSAVYDLGEGEYQGTSGTQILAEGIYSSLDCQRTRRNNNVLLFGSPGSGKTSLIKANLYQAVGSYVVSDPKGRLYKEFKTYLERKGYRVGCLDFKNLYNGESCHYNPFSYLKTEEDILKMSRVITDQFHSDMDRFWDETSALLYNAIIGYLVQECPESMRTLRNLVEMLCMAASSRDASKSSELDYIFDEIKCKNPGAWSLKQYQRYRGIPTKTLLSVIITAQSKLMPFDTPAVNEITSRDDIELASIGQRKTAVFVSVSDVDRSQDALASLFFNQVIMELVRYADEECLGGSLPVQTRLFMDDFATNLHITDYPRIISSIRSRGLSCWTICQSKGQLEKGYEEDAETIIGSSDVLIYQGGNDIATAKYVAQRCNWSVSRVMDMRIGQSLILTRGDKPKLAKNYDLDLHRSEFGLNGAETDKADTRLDLREKEVKERRPWIRELMVRGWG